MVRQGRAGDIEGVDVYVYVDVYARKRRRRRRRRRRKGEEEDKEHITSRDNGSIGRSPSPPSPGQETGRNSAAWWHISPAAAPTSRRCTSLSARCRSQPCRIRV